MFWFGIRPARPNCCIERKVHGTRDLRTVGRAMATPVPKSMDEGADVCPTEDAVKVFLDYLVEPKMARKSSAGVTLSLSDRELVAKQVHAVVLLYNYYHRKQHPPLEYVGFKSFCRFCAKFKPGLTVHFNFMASSVDTAPENLEKLLSLTEKKIMDACDISMALDISKNNPSLDGWPISKVAVFLVDSKKKNCMLHYGSIVDGVWSMIEKDVNSSGNHFEGSLDSSNVNKKRKVLKRPSKDNLCVEEADLEKLAYLAVKEATGIDQNDLIVLESHVTYSITKEKAVARLYIMKCIQPNNDSQIAIPIADAVNSLQGPLVTKSISGWTHTSVVEYFHLLPYNGLLMDWFSRDLNVDNFQVRELEAELTGADNLEMTEILCEERFPLAHLGSNKSSRFGFANRDDNGKEMDPLKLKNDGKVSAVTIFSDFDEKHENYRVQVDRTLAVNCINRKSRNGNGNVLPFVDQRVEPSSAQRCSNGFTSSTKVSGYHPPLFLIMIETCCRQISHSGLELHYLFRSWGFLCPVHTPDGEPCGLLNHMVFMEISCPDGGNGGRSADFPATHEEIHPTRMLSVVANLTPWSDHNQSPRNMYQCQMAKQTMAFSLQALCFRADQKLYHLQTPQSPIVRTSSYSKYNIDEYPTGTNAIVAVLAYTGYDMEDAMILNKSSVERGMCHGQIYQTETIDLSEESSKTGSQKIFRRSNLDKSHYSIIDSDGLPYVGQIINPDEPYCSIHNETTGMTRTNNRKGSDPVFVDYVAIDTKNKKQLQKVNIRFRHPRNPIIGDKFSSRHGQKGVCSQLWPDIDMPFSEVTGMRPDLIINPHAFPSRMTIGMLLESLAAKGGSLEGKFVDATPFASSIKQGNTKSEPESLVDELGEMLRSKGFNYYGVEVLYSGVYGTALTCEIFIGPVYYQRLRHMVSDKFQVRSTGTVDQITRQPIKGRKRGGGIRFGEMERDSMLAHGAAYLLHDRLHTCSDYHIADVCSLCGSILTTSFVQSQKRIVRDIGGLPPMRPPKKVACHSCQTSKGMETVAMPYVFRYLAAELAAMNIKMTLKLRDGAGK